MTVQIRAQRDGDRAPVAALLRSAFPGEPVDRMVDALRTSAGYHPELALVAVDSGRGPSFATDRHAGPGAVLGFVMLTTIQLERQPWQRPPGGLVDILCLSPLAVAPDRQREGIGRALVERVLALAAQRSEPYVVLEGDPRYYRRLGFVPSTDVGVTAPSERIPDGCFQVFPLHASPLRGNASGVLRPSGRALYSAPFRTVVTPGLAFDGVAWLDELERHARSIEATVAGPGVDTAEALAAPVRTCPGWTVGDVLRHLGIVERVVAAWIRDGRRPRSLATHPEDGDVLRWFAEGWRALYDRLAADPADSPAATWSPWEATNGFWRRKQVHEHAIHALDVLGALGRDDEWLVSQGVALDGIDEVVRLWLGTCLGTDVRGRGDAVRLAARTTDGGQLWTVVLNPHNAELHRLPLPPDATVTADPTTLYRWLWGRATDCELAMDGDLSAVAVLRAALSRVLQ